MPPTAQGAIEAQASALDAFVIDGIRHNIPFLSALMQHPRWRSGKLSTGFIAEEFPDGFAPLAPAGEIELALAAVAAHVDHVQNIRKRGISGQLREAARLRFDLKRAVLLDSKRIDVEVDPHGEAIDVVFADGRRMNVKSEWSPGEPVWRGDIDGQQAVVQVRAILNGFTLAHRGIFVAARVYTHREAQLATLMIERKGADQSRFLLCPMPGLVKSIAVREGQEVKAGEPLCMVEAMKMENVLIAERDAMVKKIVAKEGDSLAVDAVIMEFE
jgi:propionyl-CoA carboxylase alpha chain